MGFSWHFYNLLEQFCMENETGYILHGRKDFKI